LYFLQDHTQPVGGEDLIKVSSCQLEL
jgi:hypothetical protein